jgi:hypothetical protein
MRLIRRNRSTTSPLEEGECYEHSYGTHVLGHVDVVPGPPEEVQLDVDPFVDPHHHVTTERLKRQFEERLARRPRRGRKLG